jgi:hypothetical protein
MNHPSTLIIAILICFANDALAADGYFHTEQREGKWLMIDPAGKPFHMRGCNHYGNGSHMPWNLAQRYDGDRARWMKELRDRHEQWGFTFLAPSIGPSVKDPATVEGVKTQQKLIVRAPEWTAAERLAVDFPFTAFLGVPHEYMAGEHLGDVWSAEFLKLVDDRCRELCLPLKDSKQLVGYHLTHNPPWNARAKSFGLWVKDCTRPGTAGLQQWVRLMQRVYGSIERWRAVYGVPIQQWSDIETLADPLKGYVDAGKQLEDMDAFMALVCEQWYRVYHDSIRRYDPHHLILGDRNTLHLQPPAAPFAIQTMKRYVDVLSVNVMGPPRTVYGLLEHATRHWDGPILLADTGAGVYEGEPAKAGYQSANLAEFEACYRGLMEMTVEHPQIIGFGWCGWYETPHPGGRSGLVDVRTDEPLPERLAIVKKWNAWMAEQKMPQTK